MGDRLLAWGIGRTHREMPRASGGRPWFFTDADLHATASARRRHSLGRSGVVGAALGQ